MKLTINQNSDIRETEIIINCSTLDRRVRNLADYIRQYSTALEGQVDGTTYYIPLDSILYIDSVDKRTFFYDEYRTYSSQNTLAEVESKVKNTSFVRISKNCLVNMAFIHGTNPYENHRIEIVLINGEHLIAARSYKDNFKERFQDFHSDAFCAVPLIGNAYLKHDPERSIYNLGKILSFTSAPKRVVALSYESAEILAALELSDCLVAIAPAESSIKYVLPDYQQKLACVPTITDHDKGVPALSELQSLNADFILGNYFALHTLKLNSKLTADEFGLNMYVSEGTIPGRNNMESVYRDILNYGRIFRAEDRAIGLVELLRKRVACLTRLVPYAKPVRVFVFDSGEASPRTSMKYALENHLITIAGGENIFGDIPRVYGTVTWKEVADSSPDVIIIHDYIDNMNTEQKIAFLRNKEELKDIPAMQNNRFVKLSQLEIFPGVQNVSAVEKLIRVFHDNIL